MNLSKKEFLDQLLEDTDTLAAVQPAPQVILPTQKDKKQEWLESIDLLDEKNREIFIKAIYGKVEMGGESSNKSTDEGIHCPVAGLDYRNIATAPEVNLITICGKLSNLSFKEEDMIKLLEPTAEIQGICCNYGEKYYSGFINKNEKVKKSNRGRKKKPKPEKKRKVPGNGKHFNSQISFIIPYNLPRAAAENKKYKGVIPADVIASGGAIPAPKDFKLKVFRTGLITLADVKQQTLEVAIEKVKLVAELFNKSLNREEGAPDAVKLVSLTPIMKNCEFSVFIEENEFLDLESMSDIINKEIKKELSNNTQFSVLEANHPQDSTKLFIKFKTPNVVKPTKKMRVNIFQASKRSLLAAQNGTARHCIKINTLGGLEDKNINNVFFTICNLFMKYKSKIIIEFE